MESMPFDCPPHFPMVYYFSRVSRNGAQSGDDQRLRLKIARHDIHHEVGKKLKVRNAIYKKKRHRFTTFINKNVYTLNFWKILKLTFKNKNKFS